MVSELSKKKIIIIIIIRLPRKDIRAVIAPNVSGIHQAISGQHLGSTGGEMTPPIHFFSALQWKLRIDGNAFILEKKNKLPKLDLPSVQVAVMAHNLRNARGRLI